MSEFWVQEALAPVPIFVFIFLWSFWIKLNFWSNVCQQDCGTVAGTIAHKTWRTISSNCRVTTTKWAGSFHKFYYHKSILINLSKRNFLKEFTQHYWLIGRNMAIFLLQVDTLLSGVMISILKNYIILFSLELLYFISYKWYKNSWKLPVFLAR